MFSVKEALLGFLLFYREFCYNKTIKQSTQRAERLAKY